MDIQDYDGDQLMFYRPVDWHLQTMAYGLRPDNGFMSANDVGRVAHGMVLHNEVISMQNNFLLDEEQDNCEGIPLEAL